MLKKLAGLWSVNDSLPCHAPSVIALISFGATKRGLTKGAQATTERAAALAERYQGVPVLFGTFSFSPSCPSIEERIKTRLFKNPVFVGEIDSTIDEAEKMRDSLLLKIRPRTIVVVTDEWHSRSVRWVWNRVWRDDVPRPDIRVVAVPSSEVISNDNPTIALRKQWVWALSNVLRHLFLVCVPGSISIMKKLNIHQPVG